METRFHFGMAIERGNKRRVCALGHVGKDIREVPGGLVLVENQRQSQAIGHSKVILPQTAQRHTFRTVTVRSAGSIVGDVDTKDAAGRSYLQMSDRRRLRFALLAVTLAAAIACAPEEIVTISPTPAAARATPASIAVPTRTTTPTTTTVATAAPATAAPTPSTAGGTPNTACAPRSGGGSTSAA